MKLTMSDLLKLLFFLMLGYYSHAQRNVEVVERLGFSPDDKLLIIHADDLGVAHSVNVASIEAFEAGYISSASMMVPCPWFPHIAQYAENHPELCWGIHLTLTAEWEHYKWDGVSSSNEISSILTDKNFMYASVPEVVTNYEIEQITKEIDGQVQRAIQFGVPLSHLDSHMGTLFSNEELFKAYLKLGNKYKLPVLLPYNRIPGEWNVEDLIGPYQVAVNQILMLPMTPDSWQAAYSSFLADVKPGINELIVHLGKDNPELQEVMINHPEYGATWRQEDLNVLMSDTFRVKLKEEDIHVISWKMIRDALENKL